MLDFQLIRREVVLGSPATPVHFQSSLPVHFSETGSIRLLVLASGQKLDAARRRKGVPGSLYGLQASLLQLRGAELFHSPGLGEDPSLRWEGSHSQHLDFSLMRS